MKFIAFFLSILAPLSVFAQSESEVCIKDSFPEINSCENITYLPNPKIVSRPLCLNTCLTGWTLSVRGAFYHPTSKSIKHAYSNSLLDYQVEASKKIQKYLEVWTGVSWAAKQHGHVYSAPYFSTTSYNDFYYNRYDLKTHTKMYILPLSIGIKFVYPLINRLEVYFGAGLCYSFLKITSHCKEENSYSEYLESPFKKHTQKRELGGIVKAGFRYDLGGSVFLDVFVDYFSQRFYFKHNHYSSHNRSILNGSINYSGLKIGAGLGVFF
jgi:outer membrane protein W